MAPTGQWWQRSPEAQPRKNGTVVRMKQEKGLGTQTVDGGPGG